MHETELIALLPRLERICFETAHQYEEHFSGKTSRTKFTDGIIQVFCSVLRHPGLSPAMTSIELDYCYVLAWTGIFAGELAVQFDPSSGESRPLTDLSFATIAGPRFRNLRSPLNDPFEILAERSQGEYVTDEDVQPHKIHKEPYKAGFEHTMLIPYSVLSGIARRETEGIDRPITMLDYYAFVCVRPDAKSDEDLRQQLKVWLAALYKTVARQVERGKTLRSCLVVPVYDGIRTLGVCEFVLRERPSQLAKLVLANLAKEVFRALHAIESAAVDARVHSTYGLTTSVLSFCHEAIDLLHAQASCLEAFKKDVGNSDAPGPINRAAQYAEELISRISDISEELREPGLRQFEASLQDIARAIHDQVPVEYRKKVLVGFGSFPSPLRIDGTLAELAQLVLPFIHNLLQVEIRNPVDPAKAKKKRTRMRTIFGPNVVPDDYAESVIFMHVNLHPRHEFDRNKVADLGIGILYPGQRLPEQILNAMADISLFGRLPSTRQGGGRGILSTMAVIQNRYGGRCQIDGPRWTITIPVALSSLGVAEVRAELDALLKSAREVGES